MSDHDDRGESGSETSETELDETSHDAEDDEARAGDDSEGEDDEVPSEDDEMAAEDEDELDLDDVDVKDLLRQALAPPKGSVKSIAPVVQRKIREESKGRFFADGWSTTSAPVATFLVTSLLMLAIVILAYVLMSPLGIELPH